jgi:hypothetical protein
MASVEVKILVSVAVAACVYLLGTQIRQDRRTSRLIQWVQANYPEAWDRLHWTLRRINRMGALAHLYRNNAIPDPHFAEAYRAIKPFQKDQIVGFVVGAGAIALAIIGARWWGWSW